MLVCGYVLRDGSFPLLMTLSFLSFVLFLAIYPGAIANARCTITLF